MVASDFQTAIAILALAVVTGIGFVILLARQFGRGFKEGRIYENNMLCKHMKAHYAGNGEWHELLGQFHEDVDVVIINSTRTRELGIPTYLYTALHEGYHSWKHMGQEHTPENTVAVENEANDFAVAVLPAVMQAIVDKGYLKAEDAKMPEIFRIDGVPEVVYGDALAQLQELVKLVKERDPNAVINIKRRPENNKTDSQVS